MRPHSLDCVQKLGHLFAAKLWLVYELTVPCARYRQQRHRSRYRINHLGSGPPLLPRRQKCDVVTCWHAYLRASERVRASERASGRRAHKRDRVAQGRWSESGALPRLAAAAGVKTFIKKKLFPCGNSRVVSFHILILVVFESPEIPRAASCAAASGQNLCARAVRAPLGGSATATDRRESALRRWVRGNLKERRGSGRHSTYPDEKGTSYTA